MATKLTDKEKVSVLDADTALVFVNQGNKIVQVPASELKSAGGDSGVSSDSYYGVRITFANSSPKLTRIGQMTLHKTLPIQSNMRRCLVGDDGNVNDWLNATNSALTSAGYAADLTGASGMVEVRIPGHYRKFEQTADYCDVKLATVPLPGFEYVPEMFISAFEATVDRTSGKEDSYKLASVVNKTANFRGGNNDATLDSTYKSQLGMPATNINLTKFRQYAKQRGAGWYCNTWQAQKTLYWLFVVEYATLNSQEPFNAALTAEGFHQGGLGPGITNIDYGKWNTYNGIYPICPCGQTVSLGNATGVKTITGTDAQNTAYGATLQYEVCSYRGIENPFGHIWKWTDGVLMNTDNNVNTLFVCDNIAHSGDTLNSFFTKRGIMPSKQGSIKSMILGETGEIAASATGGTGVGENTYFCDTLYLNEDATTNSGIHGFLAGGAAGNWGGGGLACVGAANTPADARTVIGSRLCRHSA